MVFLTSSFPNIKRMLIANRGEIAVRVIRTCRELGIQTVALYDASDVGSLHVRRADEAVKLDSPRGFSSPETILRIAREKSVDSLHPGYGFLAEEASFVRACNKQGIVFIGPPAPVMEATHDKLKALERAESAGFRTTRHSPVTFGPDDFEALKGEADAIGYPLIVKSNQGGRGPGQHLVRTPDHLEKAVRRAQAEGLTVFNDPRVYLERAITPAHQIGVQVIGDSSGKLIHLGEREGSALFGNRKIIEEAPAPCLNEEQRQRLFDAALTIARLFNYQNVGTVEFIVDRQGEFYFTEIKARIQTEHPLPEMMTRVDIVAQQIRIAAGQPLNLTQEQISLNGHALSCRLNAEDPFARSLASPGQMRRVRVAGGPEVRVDTYVYGGCPVPDAFNPLIAKLTVWASDRAAAIQRLSRALDEMTLTGTTTNLSQVQQALHAPEFISGQYDSETRFGAAASFSEDEHYYRDLALAAAVYQARRAFGLRPEQPERASSGWHRDSRRLTGR